MARFLQSHVVPICTCDVTDNVGRIMAHWGSAFFVNRDGTFITARHVIERACADADTHSRSPRLIVNDDRGNSPRSMAAAIARWEPAPSPFDIAIGVTADYVCDHEWPLHTGDVAEWADVCTYGYPESAVSGEIGSYDINIRCLKGYVQRVLTPGDIHAVPNHPTGFEVSFILTPGLSGSPLCLAVPAMPLIGVCVNTFSAEYVDHSIVEVEEDGTRSIERVTRIERYSSAHDIRPLLEWSPEMLNGRRLREVFP